MPLTLLMLIPAGLLLLAVGAHLLVSSASRLARWLRIPPLVIGLTVVAFGTSAPELTVSLRSALNGQGDIAVGNVLGSNIFNVLVTLGLCALIAPLQVRRQLVRLDVPLMIGASLLAWLLALDQHYSLLDGLVLVACLLGYLAALYVHARKGAAIQPQPASAPAAQETHASALKAVLSMLAGLGLLVVGADWLITGAVALARTLGLSELIIGLTLVAAGTSLPELATSVFAALRNERDIAVGNIVGSILFNLLGVLGLSALAAPGLSVSPNALAFDFPVMTAVAVACLPVFFAGYRISRWEGLLFLGYYLAYILYLALLTTGQPLARTFATAMLGYAVPLTIVTLWIVAARAWRRQRK
jgi:cation:H+ antiporter